MKKILIGLALMCASMPALADNPFGTAANDTYSNVFSIGPRVGVNISTASQPSECNLFDGGSIGFTAGAEASLRFGRATSYSQPGTGFFGISLGAAFRQNAIKTIGTSQDGKDNANFSASYIDIPITVRAYPFAKNSALNSLYIEAGAAIDVLAGISPKQLSVKNPNNYYDNVTYNLDYNGSKLSGGAVSPIIGIGYTVPGTSLGINARYYLGVSKLAGNFDSKISSFDLSLSWMFSAGKF